MKNNYKKALLKACEMMYQNEVVDTEMVDNIIGDGKEYTSKDEWVLSRMEEILEEVGDSTHKFKVGDRVTLKEQLLFKRISVPEGRKNNRVSTIKHFLKDIEGGVVLSDDLAGMLYWNVDDLIPYKEERK